MEVRRAADLDGEWRGIRRGWCLGDEGFREELLAAVHCLNKKPAIGITTKDLSSAISAE